MAENTQVFPVVRWGISQAPAHQIGLLKLAYLSAPSQDADKPNESPIFGFSPEQLRALAQVLTQTADQLDAVKKN